MDDSITTTMITTLMFVNCVLFSHVQGSTVIDLNGCVDLNGDNVSSGDEYQPDIKDPCKECYCDDGVPTRCVSVSCESPCNGDFYKQVEGKCCEFICQDTNSTNPEGEDNNVTVLGLRLVASSVTSLLILSLLIFMIHRLRQRRLLLTRQRFLNLHQRLEETDGPDYLPDPHTINIQIPPYEDPPPPYSPPKPPHVEPPPPYEVIDRNGNMTDSGINDGAWDHVGSSNASFETCSGGSIGNDVVGDVLQSDLHHDIHDIRSGSRCDLRNDGNDLRNDRSDLRNELQNDRSDPINIENEVMNVIAESIERNSELCLQNAIVNNDLHAVNDRQNNLNVVNRDNDAISHNVRRNPRINSQILDRNSTLQSQNRGSESYHCDDNISSDDCMFGATSNRENARPVLASASDLDNSPKIICLGNENDRVDFHGGNPRNKLRHTLPDFESTIIGGLKMNKDAKKGVIVGRSHSYAGHDSDVNNTDNNRTINHIPNNSRLHIHENQLDSNDEIPPIMTASSDSCGSPSCSKSPRNTLVEPLMSRLSYHSVCLETGEQRGKGVLANDVTYPTCSSSNVCHERLQEDLDSSIVRHNEGQENDHVSNDDTNTVHTATARSGMLKNDQIYLKPQKGTPSPKHSGTTSQKSTKTAPDQNMSKIKNSSDNMSKNNPQSSKSKSSRKVKPTPTSSRTKLLKTSPEHAKYSDTKPSDTKIPDNAKLTDNSKIADNAKRRGGNRNRVILSYISPTSPPANSVPNHKDPPVFNLEEA